MVKVILFNKPYNVHSQFRKENNDMITLADYFTDKSLRIAGRLDKDSEGLLILTDDGALNHAITTPPNPHAPPSGKSFKMGKTYLVQVENVPTPEQINALSQGVLLKDGKTLPATVRVLNADEMPITLWERNPPIRERKNIPTAWLAMTIFEGKNRQIRRMTAHVGLPCLRLIRYQIGLWTLGDLAVGEWIGLTLDKKAIEALGICLAKNQTLPRQKSHHKNAHTKRQNHLHANKTKFLPKPK